MSFSSMIEELEAKCLNKGIPFIDAIEYYRELIDLKRRIITELSEKKIWTGAS